MAAIEIYDELLNSIRGRLKLVVKNNDCVIVLIMTNALMRFIAGKYYNDFSRDPYIMNKEKSLWSETIWNLMENERPKFMEEVSIDEIDHYNVLYLLAFDIVISILMMGAWKAPTRKKIKWVLRNLHDRGYNHVDSSTKAFMSFQRAFNFPLVSNKKNLDLRSLKKLFFVPLFFTK